MVLECFAGALSAGAFGVCFREHLFANTFGNEDVMSLLAKRGFDTEDHVMTSYLDKSYETLEKLGEGASGSVWKVKSKKTGEHFAMKVIKKSRKHGGRVADKGLETEINCLRKLRHRHIVNIMDSVESRRNLWIVMECADGGGLYERIVQLNHYAEQNAARVVKQVLQAVHYMHSYGVVHRDLKPENILLTSTADDADVKVADFGLAVVLEKGLQTDRIDDSMHMKAAKNITDGFCGSPICMAPEVARRDAAYGPQCDVWSIGCIAFEMLSGSVAFNAPSAEELFRLLQVVDGPSFEDDAWRDVSSHAQELVSSMLQKSPEERVSAREALRHSWFRSAPNKHIGRAHSGIHRRITSQATAATTDTLYPASHANSLASYRSRRTTGEPVTRPPSPGADILEDASGTAKKVMCGVGQVQRNVTRGLSEHSVKSFITVATSRDSSQCLARFIPEKVPEPEDLKIFEDSKVYQIARAPLQHAAWYGEDAERRIAPVPLGTFLDLRQI